jgi:hypothetical protein
MCTQVRTSTREERPWNPTTGTITIPAGLTSERANRAVRAVLAKLAIPQPSSGAVCWCGDPVSITPGPPRNDDRR